MAQDNAPNKPVHLIFLCGALLLYFLLHQTADWIWGYFTRTPDELYITIFATLTALFAGVYFYKHERTYNLVNEVASELTKVTWPTPKEVKSATIVVVIMTIISASILGIFDIVWSKVTELLYG